MRDMEGIAVIAGCRSKSNAIVTIGSRRVAEVTGAVTAEVMVNSPVVVLDRDARSERVTLKCTVFTLGAHLQERSACPTAATTAVTVELSVMKAAGHAAEVVDRTDQLDTADTDVKTEDTAVQAVDNTALAVDDVDDTAAADACLQTDAHTASVFSMNSP